MLKILLPSCIFNCKYHRLKLVLTELTDIISTDVKGIGMVWNISNLILIPKKKIKWCSQLLDVLKKSQQSYVKYLFFMKFSEACNFLDFMWNTWTDKTLNAKVYTIIYVWIDRQMPTHMHTPNNSVLATDSVGWRYLADALNAKNFLIKESVATNWRMCLAFYSLKVTIKARRKVGI